MNAYVVDAQFEHIQPVASAMRQADVAEIWASGKIRPEMALRLSLALSSYVKTIMIDGRPVGMFGVTPSSALSGKGSPWLLGTAEIETISRKFLRGCKFYVPDMLSGFSYLENWVDARNIVAIQWLKWLGFVIMDPEPHGHLDLPFHRFYMENPNV